MKHNIKKRKVLASDTGTGTNGGATTTTQVGPNKTAPGLSSPGGQPAAAREPLLSMKRSYLRASEVAMRQGHFMAAAGMRLAALAQPMDYVQAPNGRTDESGQDGFRDFYGYMLKTYSVKDPEDLSEEAKVAFYSDLARRFSEKLEASIESEETAGSVEEANATLVWRVEPSDTMKASQYIGRLGVDRMHESMEQFGFILICALLKIGREYNLSDGQIIQAFTATKPYTTALLTHLSKKFQEMVDLTDANTDTNTTL